LGRQHGGRFNGGEKRGRRGKLTARIEWELTFGPHAEKIANAAIEMNEPVPEDCVAPELDEECVFAHGAFHELSTDRQAGFGIGPIPWSSINAYSMRYGIIDSDEFDEFVWMVRVMDNAYVAHHAKKD
jgi:hypothetical protein